MKLGKVWGEVCSGGRKWEVDLDEHLRYGRAPVLRLDQAEAAEISPVFQALCLTRDIGGGALSASRRQTRRQPLTSAG